MPQPLMRAGAVAVFVSIAALAVPRAQGTIDDFFRDFSAEWIGWNDS